MATKKFEYVPMEDELLEVPEGCPRPWRVEALNRDTGEVYITIFYEPLAQERAVEYALFKNNKLPLAKAPSASQSGSEKEPSKITVRTQLGKDMVLYLDGLKWNYDAKRKYITARPKSPIQFVENVIPTALGA
jgi:hypothetical protein